MKRGLWIVPAIAVSLIGASPAAAAPRACRLLPNGLDAYFGTDMTRTLDQRRECRYASASGEPPGNGVVLMFLRTPRTEAEARGGYDLFCEPPRGPRPKKLRIRGADEVCGTEAPTGLYYDEPSGRVEIWQSDVFFRRGRSLGRLTLSGRRPPELARLKDAVEVVRGILRRWR